jgi:hypothetical protein
MAFQFVGMMGEVRDASVPNAFGPVICFLCLVDGSASSFARIDQTDVGLSSVLPLALASSVVLLLRSLTRLAVRSVRLRGFGRSRQLFRVLQHSQWMI